MQAWNAGFTGANPGATVNYDPVGSGAGREQFLAGGVAFAGSDAYLNDEELTTAQQRCGGDVVEVPAYITPIAVVYNLEGVDDLQLAPATVAGIFDGKITKWNDPQIAADNPGATLPDQAITPVHRVRRVGHHGELHRLPEQGRAPTSGPAKAAGTWPVKGGEAAQGTSGVIGAVQGGKGTIGYADESQAGDLGIAQIKVGDEFVGPSAEAAAKVLAESAAGRGPRREQPRHRRRPHDHRGGRLPDRAGLLPDRLPEVRRRGPGRPGQGLPDLRHQRRRPAGRGADGRLGAADATSSVRRSRPPSPASPRRLSTSITGRSPGGDRRRTSRPGVHHLRTEETPDEFHLDRHRHAGAPRQARRAASATVSSPTWPSGPASSSSSSSPASPSSCRPRRSRPSWRPVGAAGGAQPRSPTSPRWSSAPSSPSVLALLVATPLAVGVALFISHYAPRRLAQTARLPRRPARRRALASSTACGASASSAPASSPVYAGSTTHLGLLPFFAGPASATGRTILTAGIVLAIMILPIITAISREIFAADARRCTRRPRSPSAPPAGR